MSLRATLSKTGTIPLITGKYFMLKQLITHYPTTDWAGTTCNNEQTGRPLEHT